MRLEEIRKLAYGTADPAYVLDPEGMIVSWNKSAVELFGLEEADVLGLSCHAALQGMDECGRDCVSDCNILKRAAEHHPLKNYDIQITARGKKQWCNVSIVLLDAPSSSSALYTLHIVRPTDVQKRLEMVMKDFVSVSSDLPLTQISGSRHGSSTIPSREVDLTRREIEVLKMLSVGTATAEIAEKLFVSRATVNNHIQHILKKLSAHTRLEAVRIAERAGLL